MEDRTSGWSLAAWGRTRDVDFRFLMAPDGVTRILHETINRALSRHKISTLHGRPLGVATADGERLFLGVIGFLRDMFPSAADFHLDGGDRDNYGAVFWTGPASGTPPPLDAVRHPPEEALRAWRHAWLQRRIEKPLPGPTRAVQGDEADPSWVQTLREIAAQPGHVWTAGADGKWTKLPDIETNVRNFERGSATVSCKRTGLGRPGSHAKVTIAGGVVLLGAILGWWAYHKIQQRRQRQTDQRQIQEAR